MRALGRRCAAIGAAAGFISVSLGVTHRARAEGPPQQALTLEAALSRALAANPGLRAAEARLEAMRERPPREGALPDPMLMLRYHNEDWGLSFGESDFSFVEVGVEQEIPLGGKRGMRRRIAEREVARERAMRDMAALMLLARVGMQYAELAALERSDAALASSLHAIDTLREQAVARYEVGEAEQQDVLRTALERDMLLERRTLLERERATASARLAALMGTEAALPQTAGFAKLRELPPLGALRARARELSPELSAAREDALRAQDALRLAHRELVPDVALSAAYMNKQQLMPEWEIGLRVSIPLYAGSKQRRAIAEAAHARRAAEQERRRSELDLDARLAELHAAGEASQRLVALYRDSLQRNAAATFESATASYAAGRVDLMTVTSAFLATLEVRIREAEENARLATAVAELGPLVGETPLGEPLRAQP
jgi:outer membrane protein TolC